jgi:predicted Zn finger-like uncharacterized protein
VSGKTKQCPDCQATFRASAKMMREAGGRLRCEGCGNEFIALEYPSEEEQVDQTEKSAELDTGNELVADRTEQGIEPEKIEHITPPHSEEGSTMNRLIDEELLRETQALEVFSSARDEGQKIGQLSVKDSPMAETIVMEGEMVSSTLQGEHRNSDSAVSEVKISASLKDTYSRSRGTIHDLIQANDPPKDSSGNRSGYAMIASLVLMGLFIFWQIVS